MPGTAGSSWETISQFRIKSTGVQVRTTRRRTPRICSASTAIRKVTLEQIATKGRGMNPIETRRVTEKGLGKPKMMKKMTLLVKGRIGMIQ